MKYKIGQIVIAKERMDVPDRKNGQVWNTLCEIGDKLRVIKLNDHHWDLTVERIDVEGRSFDCGSHEVCCSD